MIFSALLLLFTMTRLSLVSNCWSFYNLGMVTWVVINRKRLSPILYVFQVYFLIAIMASYIRKGQFLCKKFRYFDLQKKFQTEHKNLFSSEKHTNFLPGHKTTMLKLFNSSHKYHKRKVKSVLLFIELNEACNVEI